MGPGPSTGLITTGWDSQIQGFMRPMQIVAGTKSFELATAMLLIEPGSTAIEHFGLEGAMKTFFFALGLGVIRPTVPQLNAHPQ